RAEVHPCSTGSGGSKIRRTRVLIWRAPHIKSIRPGRERRAEAQRVAHVEEGCQGLSKVVTVDGETAADDGLAFLAENPRQNAPIEVGGPGHSDARLEVRFVAVVRRRSMVCWSGQIHVDRAGVIDSFLGTLGS